MPRSWIPSILRPDHSWPQPVAAVIAQQTPQTPAPPSKLSLRFWSPIHKLLARFSLIYCGWFGIPFDCTIMHLPFGLVLKSSERVRVEEVVAMQMARAAGMPVPWVLCVGESSHPFSTSILMTRLPGTELNRGGDQLEVREEGPWLGELRKCLEAMRQWESPFGKSEVCSAMGTSMRSQRVPNHTMGPVKSQTELHESLLVPAGYRAWDYASRDEYDMTLAKAREIFKLRHRIVFNHGDFQANNILVDEKGHLTGILDWESAGWCPEYWDFTTAMRLRRRSWWYQVASFLGGDRYSAELECDIAIHRLTNVSYMG